MDWLTLDTSPRTLVPGTVPLSPLGWGMWRFRGQDVAAARALVETVLEAGVTLFDTADIYAGPGEPFGAAEALLGRVLGEAPGLRDRMFLATKGGINPGVPYDSSAGYLAAACEASLKRLGVERVDLYQIHRPDLLSHPAAVAATLAGLVEQGKVAAVGVSNHSPAQVRALQAHLPFKLVSTQPEFSALAHGPLFDGVLDQAMELGMAVLAWSPLAGGRIAKPDGAKAQPVTALLDRIAARDGVSRSAAAYAWIMAHPSRPIPLVGTQTPDRVREAADALKVRMTRTEWYGILSTAMGAPLP